MLEEPHSVTRAVLRQIESLGYRVSLAHNDEHGKWLATAERDSDNNLHVAKAEGEIEAMTALAESVGIELEDG